MAEMADFSIDIETLSTRYDAAILSIGCVQFNRDTGEIGPRFYKEVCIDNSLKIGHVSASTLTWWVEQSRGARSMFGNKGKEPLANALHLLAGFIRREAAPRVWGNGATFDIGILEYAFVHGGHGLEAPWHFTKIRDMRTIVDAAQAIGCDPWHYVPRVGVAHHAGDDAEYQAKIISVCWQAVTGKKITTYEDDEL